LPQHALASIIRVVAVDLLIPPFLSLNARFLIRSLLLLELDLQGLGVLQQPVEDVGHVGPVLSVRSEPRVARLQRLLVAYPLWDRIFDAPDTLVVYDKMREPAAMARGDIDFLVTDLSIDLHQEVVPAGWPILVRILAQVLAATSRPTDGPAVSGALVCVREAGVVLTSHINVVSLVVDDALLVVDLPALGAEKVLEAQVRELLDGVLGTVLEGQLARAFLVTGQTGRAVELGLQAVMTREGELTVRALDLECGDRRMVRDLLTVELLAGLKLALHCLAEDRVERDLALDKCRVHMVGAEEKLRNKLQSRDWIFLLAGPRQAVGIGEVVARHRQVAHVLVDGCRRGDREHVANLALLQQ
jgi:hypothetical protein